MPGDDQRYAVPGLNNNEKYVFTVKARNKVGYSPPRSSAEMQPLGTPPAPGAPTVTDLEAGANQTSLRIAWQAVLPEGPGPDGLHGQLQQRQHVRRPSRAARRSPR